MGFCVDSSMYAKLYIAAIIAFLSVVSCNISDNYRIASNKEIIININSNGQLLPYQIKLIDSIASYLSKNDQSKLEITPVRPADQVVSPVSKTTLDMATQNVVEMLHSNKIDSIRINVVEIEDRYNSIRSLPYLVIIIK